MQKLLSESVRWLEMEWSPRHFTLSGETWTVGEPPRSQSAHSSDEVCVTEMERRGAGRWMHDEQTNGKRTGVSVAID